MTDPGALRDRAEEMAALEEQAVRAATAALSERLDEVTARATRLWAASFGAADAPAGDGLPAVLDRVRTAITGALGAAGPVVRAALGAAVPAAFALGVRQAREQVHGPVATPADGARSALAAAARAASGILTEQHEAALGLLTEELVRTVGHPGLLAAISQARRATTRLDTHVRTVVVGGVADGVRQVADAAGLRRMWVAERDACLACTRLAGVVAGPDGTWSASLTYGDRPPAALGALRGPPRHPRCRCQSTPFHPERDADYRDALQREARRSVLRGFSLPSESEPARLRAADRLLAAAAPSDAPESVRQYARRAVQRGRFPDRRPPTN